MCNGEMLHVNAAVISVISAWSIIVLANIKSKAISKRKLMPDEEDASPKIAGSNPRAGKDFFAKFLLKCASSSSFQCNANIIKEET